MARPKNKREPSPITSADENNNKIEEKISIPLDKITENIGQNQEIKPVTQEKIIYVEKKSGKKSRKKSEKITEKMETIPEKKGKKGIIIGGVLLAVLGMGLLFFKFRNKLPFVRKNDEIITTNLSDEELDALEQELNNENELDEGYKNG